VPATASGKTKAKSVAVEKSGSAPAYALGNDEHLRLSVLRARNGGMSATNEWA
jgi:hypothetical protein